MRRIVPLFLSVPILLSVAFAASANTLPLPAVEPSLQLAPLSEITIAAWASGSESHAAIDGDRLIVPLGAGGVAVYDVADPAHPVQRSLLDVATLGGQGGAVTRPADDRLFVGLPIEQKIAVFDLAATPAPLRLGEIPLPSYASNLAATSRGLVAYVPSNTEFTGGVYAFDTAQTIPGALGEHRFTLTDPGFFATNDGVAFAARTPAFLGDPAGVDVIDMGDPTHPRVRGEWRSPLIGNITGIDFVDGSRLFLSAYWGGLWVVDAPDYANMRLFASFDWTDVLPQRAIDVVALPPFVLLLHGGPDAAHRGVTTLRLTPQGTLERLDTLPLSGYPLSISRRDRLVVIEEAIDTDGDGWVETKTLRLFDAVMPDAIFGNGYD